ncbi:bacteriophage protein [Komagataeibacter xylinus NBRC 15237]|nr:bacteriophage protein [Komagataeibacter xylinus NBRC 15237]
MSELPRGIRALRRELLLYGQRGLTTVASIISVYAPTSENATGAYINLLCSRMGVQPGTTLDLNDAQTMRQMILGITLMENGPGHITLPQIDQALHGLPALPQPAEA